MTKRFKLSNYPIFITAKVIALAVLPIILFLLPKNAFDHGQSLCLFTLLSGEACFGCGMTRACMHLIHFDFETAATFNKISFIVFPILCGLYAQEFWKTFKKSTFYRYIHPEPNNV